MSTIIGVVFILALVALWAFLKFTPYNGTPRQVVIFNTMVLGLCVVLDLLWYASWYVRLQDMGLPEHLPLIGLGGAFALTTLLLVIFLLVRNFFVFKGESRPGLR